MDTERVTEKILEHGEQLAKHESDIHTLFNQQKNIQALAQSTQELALSVRELTGKVNDVDGRLEVIEQDRRQKGFAVWQIVMSAVLGGAITYVITSIL